MFAETPLDNRTVNKFRGRRRQSLALISFPWLSLAFLGFISGRLQRNHGSKRRNVSSRLTVL
jgi:hypothetical protein